MTTRRTRSQAKKEQSLKQKCQSLYLAVYNRNIQKATDFLKAGAKSDFIYIEDNMGFTAFHAALPRYEGSSMPEEKESEIHIDLLDLLISPKYNNNTPPEKLNIFSEDCYGMNPFEWAIADGKHKCTHWFLKLLKKQSFKHIAPDIINRENKFKSTLKGEKCKRVKNQTPIQLAVKSENSQIVKELTTFTPRPNVGICNANNMNAIHLAIQRRLPKILYLLVRIATITDLNTRNNNKQTSLQYSTIMYKQSLITPTKPKDILKSLQCKEIIQARIDHNLANKWESIKQQQEPTHNAVMAFWKFTEEQNPNTNILHPPKMNNMNVTSNIIHKDIENIKKNKKDKYRVVSFKEACKLQHSNKNWVTTYHGALNVKNRYRNTQRLSPFATNLKRLFIAQKQQLNFTYSEEEIGLKAISPIIDGDTDNEEEMKESECNINNNNNNGKKRHKKRKDKRSSEPIFEYNNEWIHVEAINKDLDKELTIEDRIKFYEVSIGKYDVNDSIEIREINDITHPSKRGNDSAVFGLFATKDIPKKTIILEYTGLVCSENEYMSSLGYERFERFDAQWRIFEFNTFKPDDCNRLLLDAAYYSNESVFVNDATHDDIFEKWSTPNVSFFEIVINGWPHAFLRAYHNITKGEEFLATYGNKFWKSHSTDMKISESLNKYHMHRLEREKEAMKLVKKNQRKRKRNEMDDNNNSKSEMDSLEPRNKRMKINNNNRNELCEELIECGNIPSIRSNKELMSIDNKLNELINGMNNNNNNNASLKLVKQIGNKCNYITKLWKDSTVKQNKCIQKQAMLLRNVEQKYCQQINERDQKLMEKEQTIQILQQENDKWRENDKVRQIKVKKINENLSEIMDHVVLMNEKSDEEIKERDAEITRLKEENKKYEHKLQECIVKKQKYKDRLRRQLEKRDVKCEKDDVNE